MMFRDKSISKFYAFSLAAVFALTLAGCGGGGGTAVTPDDGGTMPETCPEGQVGMPPDCMDPAPPMRPAANAKSVMAKAMAIMALEPTTDPEKAFGAAEGPFDSGTENMNYDIGVKYGEVTVTDEMDNDDAEDDMKLMHMGGAPHGDQGDWAGSMFARVNMDDDDMETSTEKVIVYTDIEEPDDIDFAKVTGQELDARDLDLDKDADKDGTDTNDWTALSVVTANVSNIMADGFSATGAGSLEYKQDDTNTDDKDEAFETAGTYNGAKGTYRCNGAVACSVTYDADGKITVVSNGWVFTPGKDETSPVPDSDYLHYGFWVDSSMDEDGNPVYKVQTFSDGNMAFGAGDLTTLSGYATKEEGAGSATYTGTAAGVYAQKIAFDSGTGALVSGHVGSFTANVTLTAEFGEQNSVAQTMHNTISGTISDFMDGKFELGWEATLKSKAFADVGDTSGGDGTADGSWSSAFFGPSAAVDHDADADTDMQVPMPTGVAGEFVAHFGNGHAAGAYGASK